MTITEIIETPNNELEKMKILKEKMDLYVEGVPDFLPNYRNGSIALFCGSGGFGKTQLLMHLFSKKRYYRNKFHNLYYFCPSSSFLSLKNHVFEKHDKIYHELTISDLNEIYDELVEIKENSKHIEYSMIIIDDFANQLKDNHIIEQLNKMVIKARHIACGFIFTAQSYFYMPKIIRKQLTYCVIYKPKNVAEFESISKELFNMNKDDSLVLFNYCFDKVYNHLDVDTVKNIYYKNFNLLEIKNK